MNDFLKSGTSIPQSFPAGNTPNAPKIAPKTSESKSCKLCWAPYGKECKYVYIIFAIIIFLIIAYWLYLRFKTATCKNSCVPLGENDGLNVQVMKLPYLEDCCSWWPISHFALFFILGLLFPHCGVLIISGGIIWELVEMLLSYFFNHSPQRMRTTSENGLKFQYTQNWWAGSFKDVFFDVIGFFFGKFCREMFDSASLRTPLHGPRP
jgi:hypothetical protein